MTNEGKKVAKRSPSQNSAELDHVLVEYDPVTGGLRVILTDSELPAGLVLAVPKGGRIEKTLTTLINTPQPEDPGGAPAVPVSPQQEEAPPATKKPAAKEEPVPTATGSIPIPVREDELQPELFVPTVGNIPKIRVGEKGNVISLVSPRAQSGQSTAAVMLASSFLRTPGVGDSANPYKVLIVDLDLQDGSLQSMVPAINEGSKGIYNSGVINQETLLQNITKRTESGFHILPLAKESWDASDWLGVDFFNRVVDVAKDIFDIIILDIPVKDIAHVTDPLLKKSDVILITNTINLRQELNTRQWLQSHFNLKSTVMKTSVIFTNSPTLQVKGSWDELQRIYRPIGIIGNVPMDTSSFLTAMRQSNFQTLYETKNIVAEAYSVIADRLTH